MTICIVWLLAYVGQVLELENRPMSVANGRHVQDCHHDVNVRKFQNGQTTIDGNLLLLKAHPYEGSHRDDLSELLVDKRPIYSWTTSDMLVDGIIKEPKDLNTNLLSFSPGLSNIIYPEYMPVTSPYVLVSSMSRTTTEPIVDDALFPQHHHLFQQKNKQQRQHHHHHQQQQQQQLRQQQRRQLHQRNKKRRLIDHNNKNNNKHSENQAVEVPILIYYNGEKILPEKRQSEQVDVYEQRLNSPMKLKTEPIYERYSKPSSLSSIFSSSLPHSFSSYSSSSSSSSSSSLSSPSFSSGSDLSPSREFFNDEEELAPSKPFIYEINDPTEKKNQITIRRRSVDDLPGESSSVSREALTAPTSSFTSGKSSLASHFIRSIRGSRHYDVPQIECPASEEGMERFACPTPDRMGRYRCIDDHVLCDGFTDCPQGEDENMQHCMFFKTTRAHLDVLADAILRWARGR